MPDPQTAPDYLLDIPYTSNVYPELSPPLLRHACQMAGRPCAPLDQPFTYADFGCGYGLTTCILAAAMPQGRFWGVDFNAAHIQRARAVAARAGLTNVTFLSADFADFSGPNPPPVPPLDYAVAHGVLSWVGDAVRGHLLRALQRLLKPGAALYMSYNAMPGQALLNVLRDAMHTYTAHMTGDVRARVRAGMAYLRFLRDHDAPLFSQNPMLSQALDHLADRDPTYIAHEYFTPHRRAFAFPEVAALLAPFGLRFAGSLPLYKNHPTLAAPDAFTDTLDSALTRTQREAHTDLICNTTFRRDVFWMSPPDDHAPPSADADADADTHDPPSTYTPVGALYGTPYPRASLGQPVQMEWSELSFASPIFPPLLDALATRADTADALYAAAAPARPPDATPAKVARALAWLTFGDQAQPFVAPTAPPDPQALTAPRFSLTHPLNAQTLTDQLWRLPLLPLACAPMGAPLLLPFIDALMLHGVTTHGVHGLSAWALDALRRHRPRLFNPSSNIAPDHAPDADDTPRRVAEAAASFLQHQLPKLLALGVIQPADGDPTA